MEADFAAIYAPIGWPSIAPEQLLRGLLLQAFYSVRSERQLMEQLDHNLLFRWFVGLGIDDPVWNVTVFTNIEEIFGWLKTIAGLRQTKFRGLARIRMAFTFALAAYNLIRMPKLVAKTA